MTQKIDAVAVMARFPERELAAIENWRRAQMKIPPLSHAVRALVRRGLHAVQEDQSEESTA
jgi:hypothetical protein